MRSLASEALCGGAGCRGLVWRARTMITSRSETEAASQAQTAAVAVAASAAWSGAAHCAQCAGPGRLADRARLRVRRASPGKDSGIVGVFSIIMSPSDRRAPARRGRKPDLRALRSTYGLRARLGLRWGARLGRRGWRGRGAGRGERGGALGRGAYAFSIRAPAAAWASAELPQWEGRALPGQFIKSV